MKTLVYLASPYSHPDPHVREARFQTVCQAAASLMRNGVHVFSPIAHTHHILLAGGLPGDWEYWKNYDEAVLQSCFAMAILKLPGWETSRGIHGETEIARRLNIPIYRTDPDHVPLDYLARYILGEIRQGHS